MCREGDWFHEVPEDSARGLRTNLEGWGTCNHARLFLRLDNSVAIPIGIPRMEQHPCPMPCDLQSMLDAPSRSPGMKAGPMEHYFHFSLKGGSENRTLRLTVVERGVDWDSRLRKLSARKSLAFAAHLPYISRW